MYELCVDGWRRWFNNTIRLLVGAASHIKAEVDNLASRFPNTDGVLLEVDRRRDELEKLVQSHDIVIRYTDCAVSVSGQPSRQRQWVRSTLAKSKG